MTEINPKPYKPYGYHNYRIEILAILSLLSKVPGLNAKTIRETLDIESKDLDRILSLLLESSRIVKSDNEYFLVGDHS